MKKKLYHYFTYLNFDVVLGACGSSFLAQWASNHFITAISYWYCLAAAVWCIYISDRLLDVRSFQLEGIATPRHQFAYQNRSLLSIMTFLVAISGFLVAILFLPQKLLLTGIAVGIAVLLYLFLVNYFREKSAVWFSKEISLSVIYTTATWGSAFVVTGTTHFLMLLFFFGLLLADMLVFSYYEYEIDIQQQQRSLARLWGKERLLYYFYALMALLALLLLFIFISAEIQLLGAITLLAMYFTVLFMVVFSSFFSKYERHRFWGDWLFSYPFLGYLVQILIEKINTLH